MKPPVHVKNRLILSGPEKQIKALKKFIANQDENRLVDFSKVIPYPEGIYMGAITAEAIEQYGTCNWYDFNKSFWGTYYNAYEAEIYGNIIDFLTSWKPPIKVIKQLALAFPDVTIEYKYGANKAGGALGYSTFLGNEVTQHDFETRDEAIEFHKKLWPAIEIGDGMKP